ncbi:hypothetical protein LUZ63_009233 [Rhynchospora breviuscula]|uniref:F-box domain-containing protein n=1 Tax=Rhynchospora breviuscula TaxID=2022672 RepID=A0A9Q0HNY1_9POAL|nr:hypothetical protein LUZ63_009233 [Rhynchospora breviuscula]
MRGDWSELNSELLHLISKKLENFSNLIRFRSVCKQWRLAVEPADLTAQLPYLLQPDQTNSLSSTDYHVFSVSSNTTSRIKLPISHLDFNYSARKATYMGFLLVDSSTHPKPPLFLFNPLTETKLHLPFLKGKGVCKMVYVGPNPNPNSNSKTIKEGAHLVVCVADTEKSVMFWRSNDDKVTTLRLPFYQRPVLYYKGKLFVNQWLRPGTIVFDMETGAETEMNTVIPNPTGCFVFNFFVEAIGMGDLLGVIESRSFDSGMRRHKFVVYRLEHTDDFKHCRWIELNGIGERVLFLNIAGQGFCLRTSNLKGFRGNCIYYLDLCKNRNKDDQYRLLRYNMNDGTTEELQNNVHSNATWFVPSLS